MPLGLFWSGSFLAGWRNGRRTVGWFNLAWTITLEHVASDQDEVEEVFLPVHGWEEPTVGSKSFHVSDYSPCRSVYEKVQHSHHRTPWGEAVAMPSCGREVGVQFSWSSPSSCCVYGQMVPPNTTQTHTHWGGWACLCCGLFAVK